MSQDKLIKEDGPRQVQERAHADMVEDVEQTSRYIKREGLCSTMKAAKWQNLVLAMRSLGAVSPRYRHKHVCADKPDDWDEEWFHRLRAYSVVEWIEIDSVDSSHSPPTDHSAEVEQVLRANHVPYSREGPYLRVGCYTRPGTSPTWA